MESKHDKFVRLANARVQKIVESLRILANLSSQNYEYGDEEVDRMFSFLRDRVTEAESKFRDIRSDFKL